MKLETVIGLEIHVQLKTRSKMFCSCSNIFGDVEPNTAICPICLGYPGTLPVPNAQAIDWIQLAGSALNCKLAEHSKFDRKHYFYPDLPKGYQISQYDQPFCGTGHLTINVKGEAVKIGITRAHLEEDAAKNTHPKGANHTLVDYNRAGTPLVEIVTEPDIRTPEQAKVFLQELKRIVVALDITDADMEKGQLRCDANISIRKEGSQNLNPKTEIKNLNSFRNVERALKYEIERQTAAFEKGEISGEETTRGFNADKGVTTAHRSKEGAADYRYFPEPDIPPFRFTADQLQQVKAKLKELPHAKRERFQNQYRLTEHQAATFINNDIIADFFENTISEIKQLDNEKLSINATDIHELAARAAKLVLQDLHKLIQDQHITAEQIKITPANFAEIVVLLHQGKMNSNATAELLAEMQKTGGDPDHILQNLGLEQVSDTGELEIIVATVIEENPEIVEKIKDGKDGAIQFLMGQVMGKTQGKANPKTVIDLLNKQIKG